MPARRDPGRGAIMRRLASVFVLLLLVGAASARAATSYAFPLRVSSNGRYLVDQNEQAFLICHACCVGSSGSGASCSSISRSAARRPWPST